MSQVEGAVVTCPSTKLSGDFGLSHDDDKSAIETKLIVNHVSNRSEIEHKITSSAFGGRKKVLRYNPTPITDSEYSSRSSNLNVDISISPRHITSMECMNQSASTSVQLYLYADDMASCSSCSSPPRIDIPRSGDTAANEVNINEKKFEAEEELKNLASSFPVHTFSIGSKPESTLESIVNNETLNHEDRKCVASDIVSSAINDGIEINGRSFTEMQKKEEGNKAFDPEYIPQVPKTLFKTNNRSIRLLSDCPPVSHVQIGLKSGTGSNHNVGNSRDRKETLNSTLLVNDNSSLGTDVENSNDIHESFEDDSSVPSNNDSSDSSSSSSSESSASSSSTILSNDSTENGILASLDSKRKAKGSKLNQNRTIQQVKHKSTLRQKQLRRILVTVQGSTNLNSDYGAYMKGHEDSAQDLITEQEKEQPDYQDVKNLSGTSKKPLFLSRLYFQQSLRFERHHAFPATVAFFWYLLMHSSLYEIMLIFNSQVINTSKHPFLWTMTTILVGLALTRYSGALWDWVDDDLYEGIKFDFHNKFYLGYFDAKILKWLRRHPEIRGFLEILGLYIAWMGMEKLLAEKYMPALCENRWDIAKNLPSSRFYADMNIPPTWTRKLLEDGEEIDWVQHNTYINEDGESEFDWVGRVALCDTDVMCCNGIHSVWANIDFEDEEYFMSQVSSHSYYSMMGYVDSAAYTLKCSVGFYVFHVVLSLYVLRKLKIQYWC